MWTTRSIVRDGRYILVGITDYRPNLSWPFVQRATHFSDDSKHVDGKYQTGEFFQRVNQEKTNNLQQSPLI